MLRYLAIAATVIFAIMLAIPAKAQVLPFELRGGAVATGVGDAGADLLDPARISDANVEFLVDVPDLDTLLIVGEVRPHLGANVGFSGNGHLVYAGLSWTFRVPLVPVFAEASLGGALTSRTWDETEPSRFGCAALARASGTVGFDVLPGASLLGTVSHVTDFGACGVPDTGRTDVMVRLGIRF